MIDETRKILEMPDLAISATCVRVPVSNSHSVHMNVTLENDATEEEVRDAFRNIPHITLVDNPENNEYPTPLESTGRPEVFVGRIRRDDSLENTLHVWCTADNILKGAAQNSVQILKQIMERE